MHSRERRKNVAETECLFADSASLICASQYDEDSSLLSLQLLQFSALWYGVPGIFELITNNGVCSILASCSVSPTFRTSFAFSGSSKHTFPLL
ncbi:hypothetical protein Sjap_001575 [Stephania japonica]|uniref:Uncharacterized protein n=1 Tax=Stephania japonica TaxID=461633 RepID=A0AAP0KMS0_9MAGN